jgi:ADP-heptose:LPS heptosyltransferase
MKVKFLIIRFSSIGDIVLTTPVIRCLKQQVEGAEIHYVTKKQYFSLISQNLHIDKIHLLENGLNELIKKLKEENFDYIVDLHNNLRSSILKFKLKTLSFTFHKLNFKKWLVVKFKKDILPRKHIVDRYFETVKLFDVQNDNKGLDFFIDFKNEINIGTFPLAFHKGYIAFAIGARHATKQLPADKISQICNEMNLPVILLGGHEDFKNAEKIIETANKTKIFNACGGYNLQQSASLVKQARFVITHDTGLMHIAAAFKKTIISIWGNTIPEFGMYPYLSDENSKTFEVKGLKCRPCSKLGYTKCPKRHFDCMNKQDFNSIVRYANNLIIN